MKANLEESKVMVSAGIINEMHADPLQTSSSH